MHDSQACFIGEFRPILPGSTRHDSAHKPKAYRLGRPGATYKTKIQLWFGVARCGATCKMGLTPLKRLFLEWQRGLLCLVHMATEEEV